MFLESQICFTRRQIGNVPEDLFELVSSGMADGLTTKIQKFQVRQFVGLKLVVIVRISSLHNNLLLISIY